MHLNQERKIKKSIVGKYKLTCQSNRKMGLCSVFKCILEDGRRMGFRGDERKREASW